MNDFILLLMNHPHRVKLMKAYRKKYETALKIIKLGKGRW